MKLTHLKMTTLGILLVTSVAQAASQPEPGKYTFDPAHSKIGFDVTHLVISSVEGRFGSFEGEIEIPKNFKNTQIQATVLTQSINTQNEKRDGHLRSPDFFEVDKHPKMIFKSKKISGTPKSFKMTGDLTMKGVTKEVVFDGKYLGSVGDGYGNTKVAFTASSEINRKDFGLTWNKMVEAGPTVGDKVTIDLKIQAAKPDKQ